MNIIFSHFRNQITNRDPDTRNLEERYIIHVSQYVRIFVIWYNCPVGWTASLFIFLVLPRLLKKDIEKEIIEHKGESSQHKNAPVAINFGGPLI